MNSEYIEDVTLTDIKKILTEKSKNKELNYEQKMALEHAKIFANLSPANTKKLKEKLLELNISDEIATKITDLVPNEIELNLILEKEKDFDENKKKEIIEIVNKFRKE
jgi:DNA-directed RNA polymerase subunit F